MGGRVLIEHTDKLTSNVKVTTVRLPSVRTVSLKINIHLVSVQTEKTRCILNNPHYTHLDIL